jgi:hypothetical protein
LTRTGSTTSAPILAAAGGSLQTVSGDTLTVAAGALATDAVLTSIIQPAPGAPPTGLIAIARAYDFGPDGTTFDPPATAVFHYTDEDLAGGLVDPATLRVYVYDSLAQDWQLVGGTVDTVAKTVTVELSHFSEFGIFGEMSAAFDADGDAVVDTADNCVAEANPDQLNTDGAWMWNGPQLGDFDHTWSQGDGTGNACDPNDDNDWIADADELSGAACAGIITDPILRDTDGDHLTDGWECANGSDPTDAGSKALGASSGDADGDRINDLWERRGYGASGTAADEDGDGCADLVEVASIDGDRFVTTTDRLAVARRSLNVWAPDPAQDYVLDIDKDGNVGIGDRLFVARAQLLSDWQPKSCP